MQDSLDGESKVFLDPNTFSEDGTVALTWTSFSEDSKIMAYTISKSGSDWCTIHFRKVDTGKFQLLIMIHLKFFYLFYKF